MLNFVAICKGISTTPGRNNHLSLTTICNKTIDQGLDFKVAYMRSAKSRYFTGAWSATDTLENCNKVEHDKI